MDNETYQKYDRMVQATLINIYTMSKDDNKVIYLADYNDEITTNSFNMLNEFNDLLK